MAVRLGFALSRIWVRLLAFNVLLVFVPVAGVLFLDTYEEHLLAAQERTMVQEARLLAAALETTGRLDVRDATAILLRLGQRHEARLRVVDAHGLLLADSARLGPRLGAEDDSTRRPEQASPRRSWLYRLGSAPVRLLRWSFGEPRELPVHDLYDESATLLGPEVQRALDGRYGAATRLVPGETRPTVTLYSAIPIWADDRSVVGAVLVSKSTDRILRTLDAVRLGVFRVFLASLAAAVVLSLLLATTIARPLARLRHQAEAILDRRGRLRGLFHPSRRPDEIGDLERALAELTRRLDEHLQRTEAFAADVAHELRNPLASIRSATEMGAEVDDETARRRFLELTQGAVARMERLLHGAREVSRIDALLDTEERQPVDLAELLEEVVGGLRQRLGGGGPQLLLAISAGAVVSASADRLTQVVDNLLDNAASFSPPGGTLTVSLTSRGPSAVLTVADQGPGIPAGHLERVFDRFFSYRPDQPQAAAHSGLGLAIVKAIVEGYGGAVAARNRPAGGAEVEVVLPRVG